MEAKVKEDPRWGPYLIDLRASLREGKYDPKILVDAICQTHKRGFDLVDTFAFANVWAEVGLGDVALCTVACGGCPHSDKSIDANQRILDALPHPFTARFEPKTGSGAEGDGFLAWNEPISLDRNNDGTHEELVCQPGSIMLEVGTTSSARTMMQLRLRRGVARWPYGHDRILIMKAHSSAYPSLL